MSTEYSAFAPPRGGDARLPGPAPTPSSARSDVPTLPILPTPSFPTRATPHGASAIPLLPSIETAIDGSVPPPPGIVGPGLTRHAAHIAPSGRRPSRAAVALLLVGGAITVAGVGLWAMRESESPTGLDSPVAVAVSTIEPESAAASIPAVSEPPVTNFLTAPIVDAREVVAEINDNGDEAELLDQLGLDATGNPIVRGYSVSWTFGDGSTAGVEVDPMSGDYRFVSGDGVEYRRIGTEAFVRTSSTSSWSAIDPTQVESVPRLGLDGPVTVDDVLGPVAGFASPPTSDDGTSITFVVDDGMLDPVARDAWFGLVGLDPAATPVGTGISMTLLVDTDGVRLTSFAAVAGPLTSTYVLDGVSDQSPVIERPAL